MKTDWILDVLGDLKQFAHVNGFSRLAEQLDDTAIVAINEIASRQDFIFNDTDAPSAFDS